MAFTYKAGIASVGQYQMSAIPYVTSSITAPKLGTAPLEISFPRITNFVTIRNTVPSGSMPEHTLRVGFSSLGTSGSANFVYSTQNYLTLRNGESYTGEWRVSKIYLLGDTEIDGGALESSASIIAGLTAISTSSAPSFRNWSGSLGIG